MQPIETNGHIHTLRNGLVHVYVKPTAPTLSDIQASLDVLSNYKNDFAELFLLVDPGNAIAPNREQRKLATFKFNEIVDALAMINSNLFVRVIYRFTVKLDKPNYPIKIFKDEQNAINWLNAMKQLNHDDRLKESSKHSL